MKKRRRKRKLLVSAALVASLGMMPQFGTSAQAQTDHDDLTSKGLNSEFLSHKKSNGIKMIDKIVAFNEKDNCITGFATSIPEPTRGENSAYSWTTENNGGLSVTLDGTTYYVDVNNPTGSYINHSGTAPAVSGAIDSVNADFIGNYASSGYAGALQHDTSGHTMTSVIGDFIGNTTGNSSYGGGAIFNWGNKGYSNISSITGNFIGNRATYGSGGAIYNGYNSIGATISIIDSNFINNYANQKGGAIYNKNGIVNIIAQDKDVLFTNNTSGDGTGIYNNSGIINFNANNGHKITINDNMHLGGTSNVNLNNGTLSLGENAASSAFTNLVSENYSILDLQNNHAGDVLTVSNLTTDETGLYFNTDYDDLSGIMDKLSVLNSSEGSKIILNSIKILSDNEDNTATDVQYLTGNLSNINIETSNNDDNTKVISSTDDYIYTFELSDKGHLTVNKKQSSVDLATAISDENAGGSSYTMKKDFKFKANAGALDGENRNFTIYGQNHSIDGDGKTGVEVSVGQSLTVKDVDSYENFSKGISNKGDLKVINSSFENNTNSAIYNTGGTVDVSGTFTGNKASSGGAIYSTSKGSVTVDGTFEQNYSSTSVASAGGAIAMSQGPLTIKDGTVFRNNLAKNAGGGAVSIGGSSSSKAALTVGDNVTFEANKAGYTDFSGDTIGKATASGGALYINQNFSENVKLGDNVRFVDNKAAGTGGAIYNQAATIDFNGKVEFENNTARQGGAYYQNANYDQTIQNADFIGNKANLDQNALGGAVAVAGKVQNYSTPIPDEKVKTLTVDNSNFKNNQASYVDSDGFYWGAGGAIGQTMITAVDSKGKYSRGMNVEVKNSTFEENIAGAEGGAINSDSVLNISNSTFTKNKTLGTQIGSDYSNSNEGGGALFMYDDSVASISNSEFSNNKSGTWGGAIATRGISNGNGGANSSLSVSGTTFSGNEAQYGGAVASSVQTTIQDTQFTNNTASERGGAVYVNSTDGVTNITNSSFSENNAYLGGSLFVKSGEANINNSDFTNNTATYGGAMYTTTSPNVQLNIENSNFNGNSAEEVGAIGVISNASIKNSTFKNNVATSTASNSDGAGALFLGAVSDTTITGDTQEKSVFENNQSGTRGGAISTRGAASADNSGAKLDITNTTFKNNSAQTTGGALDNYFYNSTNSEGNVYVANSAFESNSANKGGAVYNHGDKDKAGNAASLKIENSTFTGNTALTNGGAVYNEGTLSIINSSFTDNTANGKSNDIHNTGDLSFSGTNTLNGGITGTGSTEIKDGETFASNIEQQLVEVYENAKLTSQNITTTNGIKNEGTLVLTGDSNTNAITGNNGTTIIAGTLENSAIIDQAVEVQHDATLVSALENLGLTIKNDGTIVTSGTLDKAITGEGTTQIDSTMSMTSGGSITGNLDLNGGLLDLTSDNSANEYSVGSLLNSTGTGSINIDIDFTGTDVIADALKIEAGTSNSGTITINDINVIGNLSGFTAEILKGETTGLSLAISEDLKNTMHTSTAWTDKSAEEVLTQTAEWDDTFGTITWEERETFDLNVKDNTKITYDSVTEKQNYGRIVEDDTLKLLNQTTQFGTEERKFITNDATKTHTVSENLGTTAAGTMTVQGSKSTAGEITNISTIDMDGHSGFVVSNAGSTLNIDNVKFKNAINTNGGVVNVSNKNTVNITNSEFADNVGLTASTSSRGGAVYNEGGTVNIDNTEFTGNKARYGGAVYNKRKLVTGKDVSSMNISNSVFGGDNIEDGNTSTSQGGAIYNTSKMTISDSVFKNNSSAASMNGGAISNEANSDLTISGNTLFENNNSGKLGGAIYNTEKLNINGGKFKSNTAQEGGGAVYTTGTTAIDGTTFEENHAVGTVGGGAIADGNTGTININNSTFINNSSEYEGGAVAARRTQSKTTTLKLDIANSTFKGNQAGVNQDGTASVNAETHGFGGAIYNVASRGTTDANAVTISNSTFGGTKEGEGNSAVKGGAVYNGVDVVTAESRGVMNIDNSTFINNTAQVSGGAISNENVMKISNSTFTGNTANGVANDIDNTGELSLSGTNTLEGGITGDTGTTNITSGATYAKSLTQKLVNISEGAKLTVNSNLTTGTGENEGVVNLSENGLELQGGTLTGNVTGEGSTDITGNVKIADGSSIAQDISIAKNKSLTSKATGILGDVTNAGTVILTGGALSNSINGGLLNIAGDTSANAADLKVSSTNVYADKVLTLGDGELTTNVLGSGSMAINGEVINKAEVGISTEILSGSLDNTNGVLSDVTITNGSLTSNADNVLGHVDNNGTYNILGGTISNNITGNGLTNIKGDTLASAFIYGDIDVAEGVTLKYNPNVYRSRILPPSTQNIILNNASTLDISGGISDTTPNLSIADGKTSNLLMDWGDVISTNNIEGHLNVASIDMTNTNNETEAYVFATGTNPSNVAISDNVTLITTPTSANMVKYTATGEDAGKLASSVNNLVSAVTSSQTGESAVYSMTTSESTGSGEAQILDGGKLTIQGNGNDIAGSGIVVGNGEAGSAELTVKDANMKNISGDALVVKGGNTVTIMADKSDIEISGVSGNAITLKSDVNGTSTVNIDAGDKTVKIDNDIISDSSDNVVKFNSGTVEFNGLFDPAEAVVDGATVIRGGNDEDIQWTVTDGTLRYLKDSYLNNSALNAINMNGGNLDTRNGAATNFEIANFNLSADSNFYGDVDLAAKKMDNFRDTPVTRTDGTLHVAGLNLVSDATEENTAIIFTPEDWIGQGYVDYTGPDQLTAIAPIYKYNVSYDDATGNFNFGRVQNGNYTDYNPSVYAPAVAAQLGGYLTQLNSYNQAFSNMDSYMLLTSSQREAMKLRNKYAASDGNLIFDPTISQYERAAGWFRPYATFEKVGLNGGPSVDNIAYGSFMGGESKLYNLGHGWDGMWGAYIGYNGSHQNYDTVGIYQNGGTLGFLGMAYKGNFFTGLTANVGANAAEASTRFGSDNFGMLMTGIASKTGYNFELGRGENKGKFIIQPSLLASYSFVNTFNYRNSAGVSIHSDPLHAIQIEPGIKFIANLKNGWQPYAGVSMVWNILDKSRLTANNVSLPGISVDPYVRYGIGVRKAWGERFTGFTQAYVTNGGRNGIGLQAGFRWAIGK